MPRIMLRSGTKTVPILTDRPTLKWWVPKYVNTTNWNVCVFLSVPVWESVGLHIRARVDRVIRTSTGFDRNEYDLLRSQWAQTTRNCSIVLCYVAEFRIRRDRNPSIKARTELVHCLYRDLRKSLVGYPLPVIYPPLIGRVDQGVKSA